MLTIKDVSEKNKEKNICDIFYEAQCSNKIKYVMTLTLI
jgi:hypothetical protein